LVTLRSRTSPEPALRCGIATVNVPGVVRMDLEKWLWSKKKICIRGGGPSKLRLSTPYFLSRRDIDRYLAAFDEYRAQRMT
jgi:selenocysteine lyase/cysteine desulfurase